MSIEGRQERAPLKIEIEEADGSDVDDLEEVYTKAWVQTYPNSELGLTPELISERVSQVYAPETRTQRIMRLVYRPPGETHLVARVNGKVVGSCRVARADALHRTLHAAAADRNELLSLYIHPEYQGKGIGTRLWEEAKAKLDSTKDTVLSVAAYNERAIEFYKSLGFEETNIDLTSERFRFRNGSVIPQRMMLLRAKIEDTHDRP